MKKTTYSTLNETILSWQHPSGLKVFILPKKEYHKTYVTLSTPFGSNVTKLHCEKETIDLPEGIAHFMEHKLFDRNGEDLSAQFSKHSAQVNAYTMNNRTTYLFSCTDYLWENIETLLDMVFFPVFSKEGVQKEQGIITQEILMYQDDSVNKAYLGLLNQLFHTHPVRNDILGSVDSIKSITPSLLAKVHKIAYHPAKMTLFITGNADEGIITKLEKFVIDFSNETCKQIENAEKEPDTIVKSHGETMMDVNIPDVLFGIKLPNIASSSTLILRYELIGSLYLDSMLGKSSNAYQNLLKQGLINDDFGANITIEKDYAFILIGGQTMSADKLVQSLKQILLSENIVDYSKQRFIQLKRAFIGRFVKSLNSLEFIANQYPKYHTKQHTLFDVISITQSITLEDLIDFERLVKDKTHYSSFIIKPKTATS